MRGAGLFMVAAAGTLILASGAIASIHRLISFTAFNDGPVNPVVGSVDFDVTTNINNVSAVAVMLNYGQFAQKDVVGFLDVDPGFYVFRTAGPAGNVFDGPLPVPASGVDDFLLWGSLTPEEGGGVGPGERGGIHFSYTVAGIEGLWETSVQDNDPIDQRMLFVDVETVVSPD